MTSPDRPQIPTSPGDMLERTRRRAEQLRRRRRVGLTGLAAAVMAVAVAVPALSSTRHHAHDLQVVGEPTSASAPSTTSAITPPTPATTTQPGLPTTVPSATGSTSTSSPSTATTRVASARECATSQLDASLSNPSGAAGSIGYDLVLANTSAATCSLRGYPGVSFVTGGSGIEVGAPAQRDNFGTVGTVTLAPGQAARATLIEVNAHNYPPDTCQLTSVNGLRVYPPNQTAALFIPQSTDACGNPADPILKIRPVQAS